MPVSAPQIVCCGCGRPTSLWMPVCPKCQPITDLDNDELPPVIGERYRDVIDDRRREPHEGD